MTLSLHRRAFLLSASAFFASTLPQGAFCFSDTSEKGILLAPSMQSAGRGTTIFTVAEVAAGKSYNFPMPLLLGHSWEPRPGSSRLGVVPEAGGQSFCLIDLLDKKVLRTGKTSSKAQIFGGHAQYSAEGKFLFLTQVNIDDGSGTISVRDANDFRELRTIPSHGLFPHEMYLVNSDREVLVANLGHDLDKAPAPDSITFTRIDIATGKLLEKKFVFPNKALVEVKGGELPEPLWPEASYFLQVIETVMPPKKWSVVLHPHAQCLSVWEGRKIIKVLSFGPLQVVAFVNTPDLTHFAVALSDNSLVFINKKTWQPNPSYSAVRKMPTSTHLFSGGLLS